MTEIPEAIDSAATTIAGALEDVFNSVSVTGNVADALFNIGMALHRIADELQKARFAKD